MFKHQDLQMFSLKLNEYEYFHPLEVVGRGREWRAVCNRGLQNNTRRAVCTCITFM